MYRVPEPGQREDQILMLRSFDQIPAANIKQTVNCLAERSATYVHFLGCFQADLCCTEMVQVTPLRTLATSS